MKLWLDDLRDPANYGCPEFVWVKTAEDAIAAFGTGKVRIASLDHDLTDAQMRIGGFFGMIHDDGKLSGYDVILWLEAHPEFWPPEGITVHTANIAGRERMNEVIERHNR